MTKIHPSVAWKSILREGVVLQLVLLLNGLSTFSSVHLILSQGMLTLIYFLMRSTISLILSQPSFNLLVVHGYAFFSSLPFDASRITHVYTSILCIAHLISAPTAQDLAFSLCIQYR